METSMWMTTALLLLVCITNTPCYSNKVEATEGEEDKFDGVGIGLVTRPRNCKKTTRRGDLVRVTFNVSIGDGKAFETRYEKDPLEFIIGDGEMIGGFDVGLQDMCAGEVRHLTVPPQYAYGANGMGNLPSRVNLFFFVKMESFTTLPKKDTAKPNVFKSIDINTDHLLSPDEVRHYLEGVGVKDQNGDHGLKQMMRDIFKEEDRNLNGYIDHNEFTGVKRDEL